MSAPGLNRTSWPPHFDARSRRHTRWGGWLPLPASKCQSVVSIKDHEQEEPSIMKISTVGVDLAKNVFQVHAVGETGEVVVRRALRRRQVIPFFRKLDPCLIGIEACGTSHFWARELSGLGHRVKLMPQSMFKPMSSGARPTRVTRKRSARR